jgi:RNA recognition motif-containing protein
LGRFGFVKTFHLAMEKDRPLVNKGFCYCSYYEDEHASSCICKLNGQQLEGKTVVVKRAPYQTDDDF